MTDRGKEGELIRLLRIIRHHSLKNSVAVNAMDFNVSTIRPRVITLILHLQGVNIAAAGSETGFQGTRGRIGKSGGSIKDSGTTQNLKRLLIRIVSSLLDNHRIVLTITAVQRQNH